MATFTRAEAAEVLEHVAVRMRVRGKAQPDAVAVSDLVREVLVEVSRELERHEQDATRAAGAVTSRLRGSRALARLLSREDV